MADRQRRDLYAQGARFCRGISGFGGAARRRLFADLAGAESHRERGGYLGLTRPMSEPFPDVIQDLWQLSHLTTSYITRAAAGAVLLATGILDNNAVAIVVAALFLPFLSEVLAVS